MTVHGGFFIKCDRNSAALEWCSDFSLADTELSFELALSAAAQLGGALPRLGALRAIAADVDKELPCSQF